MTFFLTPDIASKNTLPMPRDDRLQSSVSAAFCCLRKMRSQLLGLVGICSILLQPIAIPGLCLRRLFEVTLRGCSISRADKTRSSIDAEIDQVDRIPRAQRDVARTGNSCRR